MNQRKEIDSLRDQLTLLLLLNKLKERGFQTQRLKLQKLVYLADIFGTIIREKTTAYIFKVYKMGPFSAEIYADIERLIFRGFTHAKEMERWAPEQDRSFKYVITKSGITKIEKTRDMPEFEVREKAVELAIQAAGHLSGANIKKLVYSEPNYIEAKKRGFSSIIDPKYEFAGKFKQMAKRISFEKYGLRLGEDEVSWLYLNFMKMIQSQFKNR